MHFVLPTYTLHYHILHFGQSVPYLHGRLKRIKFAISALNWQKNFVMPGAGLIWRCADQIFCLGLLGDNMEKPLFLRAKSWSQLIRRVGLLAGKYGISQENFQANQILNI